LLQTIKSNKRVFAFPSSLFSAKDDINFDGYKDLLLLTQVEGYFLSDYYVYDSFAKKFKTSKVLQNLYLPVFDKDKKQITLGGKVGCAEGCYNFKTLTFINGKYILTDLVAQNKFGSESYSFYVKSTEKLMNGKMETIKEEVLTEADLKSSNMGSVLKTYENKKYGFLVKYRVEITAFSQGPNSTQQAIDKGEQISATIQPSYDTIIFSDSGGELGRIEIFHEYEDYLDELYLTEQNYNKGHLYFYGPCDLRLGFQAEKISQKDINRIIILIVVGKNKDNISQNCYYLRNKEGNLIVISSQEYKTDIFNEILYTFKLSE